MEKIPLLLYLLASFLFTLIIFLFTCQNQLWSFSFRKEKWPSCSPDWFPPEQSSHSIHIHAALFPFSMPNPFGKFPDRFPLWTKLSFHPYTCCPEQSSHSIHVHAALFPFSMPNPFGKFPDWFPLCEQSSHSIHIHAALFPFSMPNPFGKFPM